MEKKKLIKKQLNKSKFFVEKDELVNLGLKEPETVFDPIPYEVNLAYSIMLKMLKDEKGCKFLHHIVRNFNNIVCSQFNKMVNIGTSIENKDAITGKKLIGIKDLAKAITETLDLEFNAKRLSGTLSETDIEIKRKEVKNLPEEVINQRWGYFSPNSDKIISNATYIAIEYLIMSHHTEFEKELNDSIKNYSLFPTKRETKQEYKERTERNNRTIPNQSDLEKMSNNGMSSIIDESTISKLEQFKKSLE